MKLTEYKVNDFVDILGSNAPAPGGGSASALAGSLGIALTAMVCELTVGREKYKEHEDIAQEVLAGAKDLKAKLVKAIDEDTEAYNKVTAVFKLPKETDEDKDARKVAMQDALKFATKAPFQIMVYAQEALLITEKAVGKSNPNAVTDLGVSALNLKSAIQGAWLNVLINLGSIKDEAFVKEYTDNGNKIINESLSIADEIYNTVLKSL